ncbi:hypothetical protein EVAR_81802_1 [Eumeta japonica]|uniref:Uncharacterized protein n=1 Tax=Eumeta variegata TaxID=151549 RepID=A0A4C1UIJ8_EUMVA|nr:hypothetical protein EVAR_81802_1 [Eumeta japonica]
MFLEYRVFKLLSVPSVHVAEDAGSVSDLGAGFRKCKTREMENADPVRLSPDRRPAALASTSLHDTFNVISFFLCQISDYSADDE